MSVRSKRATLYALLPAAVLTILALHVCSESSWLRVLAIVPTVYGLYYVLAFAFSTGVGSNGSLPSHAAIPTAEPIAVLMTVCDDFNEDAAESLLQLEYGAYHVFILDDSRFAENQARVAIWCQQHSKTCTHVTRDSNEGFKAGNLNHADIVVPEAYQLFCVLDADQVVSSDYLKSAYNTFVCEARPAFLQGVQSGRVIGVSRFASMLAPLVWAEWRYHLPYKNRYGLPTVLGHGYLIDRKALRDVGGHPCIVSEDLALTMSLLKRGHRGRMAPFVTSQETYPKSLEAIQARRFRWVRADWQILFSKYFRAFLLAPASDVESIDLWLRQIRLPLSSVYFATLGGLSAVTGGLALVGSVQTPAVHLDLGTLATLLVAASPLYPLLLPSPKAKAWPRLRALFAAVFVGLSMPSLQVAAGYSYFRTRTAVFEPTNRHRPEGAENYPYSRPESTTFVAYSFDVLFGVVFLSQALLANDIALAGIALCPIARRALAWCCPDRIQSQAWWFGFLLVSLILFQLLIVGQISVLTYCFLCSLPLLVV